jgi:hypothetical protein
MPPASGSSGTSRRSGHYPSPSARVLYAGLYSYSGTARSTAKPPQYPQGPANAEILAQAFEELVRRNLLRPTSQRPGGILPEYAVQSVSECEG